MSELNPLCRADETQYLRCFDRSCRCFLHRWRSERQNRVIQQYEQRSIPTETRLNTAFFRGIVLCFAGSHAPSHTTVLSTTQRSAAQQNRCESGCRASVVFAAWSTVDPSFGSPLLFSQKPSARVPAGDFSHLHMCSSPKCCPILTENL